MVFDDEEGSYIENKASGEILWLEERNGVYVLPAFVAPCGLLNRLESGFGRQGKQREFL